MTRLPRPATRNLVDTLKILQVISSLNPDGGGPVEGLIQQGLELTAAGNTVCTVALDAPTAKFDSRLVKSRVALLGPSTAKYAFSSRLKPWLMKNAANYDLIIIHGLWQYHGYCVSKVARALGLRYVVFTHGMLDPWFARNYPFKHLKKWLYWPWGEFRVLAGARLVLFTATDEVVLARESFWLYKARERMVGYGISQRPANAANAKQMFLSAFPQLSNTRNLLFLSRIHPKKGCDMLIDTFSRISKTDEKLRLIFAGPDGVGWRTELTKQAERLGVDKKVVFTGMLKDDMKWGAYDCAEVFVLPSHQENFGIVVAEALASGLPVLTTFKVNIWREIVASGAGIVHEDTQQGTDQLVSDWLMLSGDQKAAMRVQALACFEKNFEIKVVTQQLIDALTLAASDAVIEPTYSSSTPWARKKITTG